MKISKISRKEKTMVNNTSGGDYPPSLTSYHVLQSGIGSTTGWHYEVDLTEYHVELTVAGRWYELPIIQRSYSRMRS